MTLENLIRKMRGELTPRYGAGEADALVRVALERIKGWDAVQLAIRRGDEVSEFTVDRARDTVDRLLENEPIQYIFGVARFYGMDFKVNHSTLIPRPETAMLVDLIVDENREADLRVLDIATGSGCIAVALARHLRFARVTATDISADALAVARKNADALNVKVDFRHDDMLNTGVRGTFDIIVSNPPYIAESEAAEMEPHVLDHEPHSALFVPDDNPLLFYKAIAAIAAEHLAPRGRLYLEINPRFADDLCAMLRSAGFTDAATALDTHGRRRFVTATHN